MTIECAILGLLSGEPLAGYDLKKRMQDDPAMPWSGNNNQIYKALGEMLSGGLVLSELQPQDGLPARKVYTLTEAGQQQLRRWLLEPPEMLEPKKPFLAQLALSGELDPRQVDALLARYAQQVRGQLERCEATLDAVPDDFAAALRALVDDNLRASYQSELDWANRARAAIAGHVQRAQTEEQAARQEKEQGAMTYQRIERNGATYLYYPATQMRPEAMDATQFIGDCLGEGTRYVMIEAAALPEAFFSLRTGLAGEVMQKLGQYRVKAALVLTAADVKGKFKDMLLEANRGDTFRSFEDRERAAQWLVEE